MTSEWNVPIKTETFAEAAQGGGNWQSSLDILSDQLGARGATIIPLRGSAKSFPSSASFGEAMEHYVSDVGARATCVFWVSRT